MIPRTYYIDRGLDILTAFEQGDKIEDIAIDFELTPPTVRAIIKEQRRMIHKFASKYYLPEPDDFYCTARPKKENWKIEE